jgi:Tfp pilus assembly protein PilV
MERLSGERGETLIEVLLTILVMAIGLVAIVAAIGGSIIASDTHRGLAAGEVVTRDYGDAIKKKAIQLAAYTKCPTKVGLAPVTPPAPAPDFTPPTGWTARVDTVEYWVPNAATFPNGTWSAPDDASACNAYYASCGNPIPACDAGLQRVTFTIANTRTGYAATTVTARVLVRRNNAP